MLKKFTLTIVIISILFFSCVTGQPGHLDRQDKCISCCKIQEDATGKIKQWNCTRPIPKGWSRIGD